jgi:D-arabinose 5-phosphate isomerase GutQ
MSADDIVQRGRRVVRMESDALAAIAERLGADFARAVELIANAPGRVIVSGVGKSGLVGRKVAATLTSTGTPATFLHPVESVHGDLGIVGNGDVALLISKSGESDELLELLEHLKRFGVRTVAITGVPDSALARHCDATLDAGQRVAPGGGQLRASDAQVAHPERPAQQAALDELAGHDGHPGGVDAELGAELALGSRVDGGAEEASGQRGQRLARCRLGERRVDERAHAPQGHLCLSRHLHGGHLEVDRFGH